MPFRSILFLTFSIRPLFPMGGPPRDYKDQGQIFLSSHPVHPPRGFAPTVRFLSRPLVSTFTMGRLSSWSQFFHPSAWRLEPEPSTFAPSSAWSNKDMDPVPLNMRTWSIFNYVTYWISDATNVGTWALASSMLAIGLSW
jgi:hypothetical protein